MTPRPLPTRTPRCRLCPSLLDLCAQLNNCDVCTSCALKAIHASRQGTRARVVAAIAARDQGQAVASEAHPDERARVDAAIRQLAATGQPFSANDARAIHGVKGGVVGAAFTAARKAELIERVGREPSDSAATHGHEIGRWQAVARKERAA